MRKVKKEKLSIGERGLIVFRQAVREAIKEHKMRGLPIFVMKNGKVTKIPAANL